MEAPSMMEPAGCDEWPLWEPPRRPRRVVVIGARGYRWHFWTWRVYIRTGRVA